MTRILLLEDDWNLARSLSELFKWEGFEVSHAATIAQAARFLDTSVDTGTRAKSGVPENQIELALVDLTLPDGDGVEFYIQRLLPMVVPTIFLTARSSEQERILGLKMGADDYVTKPFSIQELILRIRNVLKHRRHIESDQVTAVTPKLPLPPPLLHSGTLPNLSRRLRLDSEGLTAFVGDWPLEVTSTEFHILRILWTHQNRVCTREFFLDQLPGDRLDTSDRSIDAHIKRVRRKLREYGKDPIKTIRGVGYKYEDR